MKLALAIVLAAFGTAAADPCTGRTPSGAPFPVCFDPGNRLSLTAGSDGFGGSIALRHEIHFADEPDLIWRLEHTLLATTYAGYEDRFTGTLYRLQLIRHARDGHILLPLGRPRKVFLPFDVGAFAEVGTLTWKPDTEKRLRIVRIAGLIDIARSHTFRTVLAFGPSAHWDYEREHDVAPFTTAMLALHLESANGRLVGDFRGEAGSVWHSAESAWVRTASVEASLERTLLAINDRPIALSLGVRYASETNEAVARIGARIVLVQARDPRVSRLVAQ